MGQASENARQIATEASGEDSASQALLSDYSATPGPAGLRTARTPATQDNVLQVDKLCITSSNYLLF